MTIAGEKKTGLAGTRPAAAGTRAGSPAPKANDTPKFNPVKAQAALEELAAMMPGTLGGEMRRAWAEVYRQYLAGGSEAEVIEQAAQIYAGQAHTLADALKPREKPRAIVQGMLRSRSVNIVYSQPGQGKTNLLLDLLMAVAKGAAEGWLPGMPGKDGSFSQPGFTVEQGSVLWVDVDSGEDIIAERLAAFSRGYNAPPDTPFYWLTFPTPTITASKGMPALTAYAKSIKASVIVFDTLLRTAGVKDENSSEMDAAMQGYRRLAEETGAAVIIIHHQRKPASGKNGEGERAGATLRGHSSIEGGIDASFLIEREEGTDELGIRVPKSRRKPIKPFGARFTYTLEDDNETLHSARFYRCEVLTPKQKHMDELKGQLISILAGDEMNTRDLYKASPAGKALTGAAISELLVERKVRSHKKGQEILYALA